MSAALYELFAVRYGTRDALRSSHFLGGDPHDGPMPMDYYVWVAVGPGHTVVIDTGFTAEDAAARKRTFLCCPIYALSELRIDPADVTDVILTHLHYDHAGNYMKFPKATFHLQDKEMEFATGRFMGYPKSAHSYDADDIAALVHLNFAGRLRFHDGEADIVPGITAHRIGGHTPGMQCVCVPTERGVVVVASDTSHFYENFMSYRPYVNVISQAEMLDGYRTLRRLADSLDHIIPGHDPLVMKKYPAMTKATDGLIVRLDARPQS